MSDFDLDDTKDPISGDTAGGEDDNEDPGPEINAFDDQDVL